MRPFTILGVQQVAIGGSSRAELAELWVELLGLEQVSEHRDPVENVDEAVLRVGHGAHAIEVDLMQPVDPQKKPRVDRPALNHVGLWVDDLVVAVEWLRERGVRFTPGGIRKGASGHDVCFIHPKGDQQSPRSGQGVLIELVQAPASVRQALAKSSG